MKHSIKFILIAIMICVSLLMFSETNIVFADELSDNIELQLENLDLSELENFFNNLESKPSELSFSDYIRSLLKGEYDLNYTSVFSYLKDIFLRNLIKVLPCFISVILVGIILAIVKNIRSSFSGDGTGNIIVYIAVLSVILILSKTLTDIFAVTKNTIENISNLTTIMSPIILTLMIASGGNVSASVYKPAVIFLSDGVVRMILLFILPLIVVMFVVSAISQLSDSIRINKISAFFSSVIKWVIGLIIVLFGVFLSVQGITSATFDGISIKAAKYTISNSVPIIGGFLRDGFDLVVAGSVLIKNSVGIVTVFILFYTILSPAFYILSIFFMLKFVAAITEPIGNTKISDFCESTAKCVNYLFISLFAVGFMLFLTVLLMIFSANAFI